MPHAKPALVLLPGMDGTGDLFAPLIEALGSDVATVVVRYPDCPSSYDEHERLARAAFPADRPFVVLGESYSGPVAISLAAAAPPGLLGYVLSTSFMCCPRPVLRMLRPVLGLASPTLLPGWMAAHFALGRFATKDLVEAQRQAVCSLSVRTLASRLRNIVDVDVREKLKAARTPGLYLHATEDRLVPAQSARDFERLACNGRVVSLEGPHFLLQANATGAAREVRAFLDSAIAPLALK